jgi:hypothetical protein
VVGSFSGKGRAVREEVPVSVDVCEVEIVVEVELGDGIDEERGIGRMVGIVVVVVVRGINSRCSTIRITQENVRQVNTRMFEADLGELL